MALRCHPAGREVVAVAYTATSSHATARAAASTRPTTATTGGGAHVARLCNQTVSCADILAVAARDSVVAVTSFYKI